MTDLGLSGEWEEWLPGSQREPDESFKWAWSAERGDLVWSVGGPGDGRPSHGEQLELTWGRAPDMAHGDVLGVAFRYAGRDDEDGGEVLEVDAFYGSHVPVSVIDWFRRSFPDALLRPSRQ